MRKSKIIIFILAIVWFCSIGINVKAASWTIVSSRSSVNSGGSFNVRITGGVAGRFNISTSSNCRASTSSIFKDLPTSDTSFNVTVTGGGSCSVNVVAYDVTDSSYNSVGGSNSVNVSIIANNTGDGSKTNSSSNKTYNNSSSNNTSNLSSDNKLKSLNVNDLKLSPEFKKDVYEYTVEIEDNIEKINIKAEANDKKAKVTGTGEKNITNEESFQVSVEAENGKVQVYTIKIKYVDSNPIIVNKGNNVYTVVKKKSLIKEFDDYKFKMIKINNQDVPALYNKVTKLTLVGLKNKKDKIYLYIYDEKTNSYNRYREYDFNGIKLVLFNNKKIIPLDYKKYKEKINGFDTTVYKLRKSSSYSLIYGMNVKNGKKNLYLYDSKENTVQRYTTEAQDALIKKSDEYYKFCIILCGVIATLILILLFVITKKESKRKNKKKKDDIVKKKSSD